MCFYYLIFVKKKFFIFIIEKTCFYIYLIFIILEDVLSLLFYGCFETFFLFVLKIYIFDIFSRTINLLNFRKHLVRSLKIGKRFIIYHYYYYYYFFF